MTWTIEAAIAAKIGFATHQNAIPIIRDLSVTAPAGTAAENLILSLSADPPFVQAQTWSRAREPAREDDIRQIEDIALAELRIAARGRDAVDVARSFGVRRLSATARARIESA